MTVTQSKHSTKMSFTKSNDEYVMRELMRLIGNGTHHSTMRMNPELFGITADEKKALLKGIADVTGAILHLAKKEHTVFILKFPETGTW